MTGGEAPVPEGTGLLEQAISYALGTLPAVTPATLSRPTPCKAWDLGMLLQHVNESLSALRQGFETGRVDLQPPADDGHLADPAADLAQTLRDRARRLMEASSADGRPDRLITVGGQPLTASVMASAAALEIAVHGWDISQACGYRRPIPYPLAVDLLEIGPLLVTDDTRYPLFAAPVVSASTNPSDRLVAFLGRDWRT